MDTAQLRVCSMCQLPQAPEAFYANGTGGLKTICKTCVKKRTADARTTYRLRPPQDPSITKRCAVCKETKPLAEFHKNKSSATGYHSECKPCNVAGSMASLQRHPETRIRGSKRYCRSLASQLRNHRRRLRVLQAPIGDFTQAQWIAMKALYRHCCVYCGQRMQRLTIDHITPLIKGGAHTASNIVPACRSCNSKKQDRAVLVPAQPVLLLAV